VRQDEERGIRFGRRHRFAVDWDTVLEVQAGTRDVKKTRVEYFTDEYADWERKFPGEVKIDLGGLPRSEPVAAATA